METITVKIADGITPELNRIAQDIKDPKKLMIGLGKQMEIEFRKHFAARDKEPNAMGWPKKHFWRDEIRKNTALTEVTANRAVLTISSPAFAMKVFGGTIKPKRVKMLTIPKTAEAYLAGSASLFPRELHVRRLKLLNRAALFDSDGNMQYGLALEVKQNADPRAWPDEAKLEDSILNRARSILARILKARTT